MFAAEPGQALLAVADAGHDHARPRLRQVQRDAVQQLQQAVAEVGAVQVVVEQPVQGLAALVPGVVQQRQLLGVRAEQVVPAVAPGGGLGRQVRAGQLGQQAAGLPYGDPGEAGGGRGGELRRGQQAPQPEQARGLRAERPVGPGEHGTQVRPGVAAVEDVEAARLVRAVRLLQLGDQRAERERRAGVGAGGHDGQGQRQPRAPGDEVVHRLRLGADLGRAEPARQQLAGFGGREQPQRQRAAALRRDQAGQLGPAGDQRQAAGRAGQQRAYLVGVEGVVEQDEHAAPGQQAAVEPCLRLQRGGDQLGRHLEGVQEQPYRLGGRSGGVRGRGRSPGFV
ncbi:hypothetical protein GCM10020220_076820 [Nonomuraea rubra]